MSACNMASCLILIGFVFCSSDFASGIYRKFSCTGKVAVLLSTVLVVPSMICQATVSCNAASAACLAQACSLPSMGRGCLSIVAEVVASNSCNSC